jgi:hypothetical protein
VPFPDAAEWLFSTIDDFSAFPQMRIGRGLYQGRCVLSGRSVELMTSDQLEPAQLARASADESDGAGTRGSVQGTGGGACGKGTQARLCRG